MHLRVAQAKKKDLADARAMEKLAKKPQLAVFDNQPESLLKGSGGEEGMRRVIGAGKRRKAAPKKEDIEISELVEEASSSDEEEADAKEEGRKFARHLMEVQGPEFLRKFHEGVMEFCEGHSGLEGGRVVPPGGVAAKTYGNVPQAPASFQRNGVMLDVAADQSAPAPKRRGRGKAMPGAVPLPLAEPPSVPIMNGAGASRSERAKMVSFLMKQKGMSLGEASKHIKAKGAKSLADLK